MGDKSKIEWTDATWNPITGCTPISDGCHNCYAERMVKRFPGLHGGMAFKVPCFHPDRLEQPFRWKKPRRVFVGSMTDLFHENVPFDLLHQVWDAMKRSPQHIFMTLTKRPDRMENALNRVYSLQRMGAAMGFWSHVWIGATAENQSTANDRVPALISTPGKKHFLSVEPMLGPVVIPPHQLEILDWVICGGESGPGARPMHPDWARSLRDQCQAASVPFFFKQWGEWETYRAVNLIPMGHTFDWPDGKIALRVGKKAAGCLLDGREWKEIPA